MMLENCASVRMWVCFKETLHGGSRHVTFKGNIYPVMPTLYKCYIAIYAVCGLPSLGRPPGRTSFTSQVTGPDLIRRLRPGLI